MLIRKDRASVYLQFERRGTAPPLFENEKEQRIWLRLYNNTKWSIGFCSFSVRSLYGDVGLVYDVKHYRTVGDEGRGPGRSIPGPDRDVPEEVPQGYTTGDTCNPYYVRSGKSIVFSIPREHLRKGLYIQLEFWPAWENRDNVLGNWPRSLVSFGNQELPSGER